MKIVDEFRRDLFALLPDPAREERRNSIIEEFSRWALSYLNQLSAPARYAWMGANLSLAAPGLRSTAFDRGSGVFKGLHIDDHERLPSDARHRAFVLFNINLGTADRYFQFVNLAMKSILQMLGRDPGSPRLTKPRFFLEHSDYPVIRATLSPGHAYLCQTQNVIHDGATNRSDATDVSLLTARRTHREIYGRLG